MYDSKRLELAEHPQDLSGSTCWYHLPCRVFWCLLVSHRLKDVSTGSVLMLVSLISTYSEALRTWSLNASLGKDNSIGLRPESRRIRTVLIHLHPWLEYYIPQVESPLYRVGFLTASPLCAWRSQRRSCTSPHKSLWLRHDNHCNGCVT